MHIIKKPLAELRPAPYNPRRELDRHDPRYRKLRRSLQDFGLVEPLIWNQRTGHVVGGHQRLRILRELRVAEVDVSVVDLPPEREKALNVILNNREAQSDWDAARLETLLTELAAEASPDFQATGFDARHLEMLRDRLTPATQEPPPEADSQRAEVILSLTEVQFEMLREELDVLVHKHGLECHVRWR